MYLLRARAARRAYCAGDSQVQRFVGLKGWCSCQGQPAAFVVGHLDGKHANCLLTVPGFQDEQEAASWQQASWQASLLQQTRQPAPPEAMQVACIAELLQSQQQGCRVQPCC